MTIKEITECLDDFIIDEEVKNMDGTALIDAFRMPLDDEQKKLLKESLEKKDA